MAQLIAPGAKLTLIKSNFSFTEGASTDKHGNVFFTDQPNDDIWKYDTDGKLSLWKHGTGRSNGTYFDAQGNLITCADEHGELRSFNDKGNATVVAKDYNGYQLNGPNDVWIDAKGGMYITDPYYQRDYWTRTKPDEGLQGEFVYYFKPGSNQFMIADSTVKKPNGIVGTPDNKHLYVADMGQDKTFIYDINDDGSLTNRRVFTDMSSDGMTLDEQGNVYLTGGGVTIFNTEGKKIEHIDVPEDWTGNLCFGGKNKDVLFITASKSVYTIQMQVKGIE